MTVGRPKEFCEQDALAAAMDVFWRQGFEATHCDELLEAMNINAGSMYATFGDKKALYEKVFDLYQQKMIDKAMAVLDTPDSPLQGVRDLVKLWGQCMSEPDCKGCLITNTLIEFGHESQGIGRRAKKLSQQIQTRLEVKLKAAKASGELDKKADPKALAAFLVNTVQGLSIMARSGVKKEAIHGVISTTLSILR